MTRTVAAIARTIRIQRPAPQAAILGLLIVATVIMPVSYRAGSDTAHPHTVFQGVIDLISGQPHHHEPEAADPTPASTLFSPLPASLLIVTNHVDRLATPGEPAEPDIPEILGLSVPISALAAIQGLRMLLLALLASVLIGRIWTAHHSLVAIPAPVESPPPRRAG